MEKFGVIFEAAGGKIRAILLREGISKNGNKWTRRVLEQIVKIIEGTPVNLYDASEKGNKTHFAHWESWRQKIPPGIRQFLPVSPPEAMIGKVANPRLVQDGGTVHIEADIATVGARAKKMLIGLIRQSAALGRSLGPSIHVAEGDIDSKTEGNIRTPLTVTKVTGFEIVSFPSAGGSFLPVLEALEGKEDRKMNLMKRLLRLLSDEAREKLVESVDIPPDRVAKVSTLMDRYPDFVSALCEALELTVPKGSETAVLEALAVDAPEPPNAEARKHVDARNKRKARKGTGGNPDAVKRLQEEERLRKQTTKGKGKGKGATESEGGEVEDDDGDLDFVSRKEFDSLTENMKNILTANNRTLIEAKIDAAKLPDGLKKFALQHWTDIIDEHGLVTLESVDDFIIDLKKGLGKSQNSGGGLTERDEHEGVGIFVDWSSGDKAVAALEGLLNDEEFGLLADGKTKVPSFHGIRQAYGVITGDLHMEGREFYRRPLATQRRLGVAEDIDWSDNQFYQDLVAARGVTEAMTTASFPVLLSNFMHKMMVRDYKQQDLKWRLIGRPERVTDFKAWRFTRLGEFANLPVVAEAGSYTDWSATPDEEEITLAIEKHGGHAEITWEMLVNDDMRKIRTFPGKMSRAAARTLDTAVFAHLVANQDYTTDTNGGVALMAAAHNNDRTTAYTYATLQTMRLEIAAQTDLDGKEALRVTPRHVLCGPELYDSIYSDLFSDGKPNLELGTADSGNTENRGKPNILRSKYGLDLHEIQTMDANDYWVTGDPGEVEMIAVGFLNGQQNPQMFVQDLDRVGVFFDNEKIRWKIRHIWKSEIIDYRGFAGAIVA